MCCAPGLLLAPPLSHSAAFFSFFGRVPAGFKSGTSTWAAQSRQTTLGQPTTIPGATRLCGSALSRSDGRLYGLCFLRRDVPGRPTAHTITTRFVPRLSTTTGAHCIPQGPAPLSANRRGRTASPPLVREETHGLFLDQSFFSYLAPGFALK